MDEPRPFLSPAPHCEPPLDGQTVERRPVEPLAHRMPRATPHDGRSGTRVRPTDLGEIEPVLMRAARQILEVHDQRRAARLLLSVMDPHLIPVVSSGSRERCLGASRFAKLRFQLHESEPHAEFTILFARLERSPWDGQPTDRLRAICGRLEHRSKTGWRITALQFDV